MNKALFPWGLLMGKLISKSMYLEYLSCSKNAWLKFNKSEELKAYFEHSEDEKFRFKQGNEVDVLAQDKFSNGISLYDNQQNQSNEELALYTQKYIKKLDKKNLVLFQPTFIFDNFLTRNDVLVHDQDSGTWHLYEVKAKNSVKKTTDKIDHIEDASFQTIILEENGLKISKIFITHLNGEYVRQESLNVHALFKNEDVTDEVKAREQNTRQRMTAAKADLLQMDEKKLACKCVYLGRNSHCKTFSYSHPYVPEYSIHDIARIGISKKKLAWLVDKKIFDIGNIPEHLELSSAQKKQVTTYKSQKPIIDNELISAELSTLKYPLYFLDYESYNPAVPIFKGFFSYQQIPFQFSLHALKNPDVNLTHHEYLHESNSNPSLTIIRELQKIIQENGTIIVWNKNFECGINKELATRHSEYKDFLDQLNNRMFDLESIFTKQAYIDHKFKGKTSLKAVASALTPEKDNGYKNLTIQNGAIASQKWFELISGRLTMENKQKIIVDLKLYCKRDTINMYYILSELKKQIIVTE
jgi:hypothetical protein